VNNKPKQKKLIEIKRRHLRILPETERKKGRKPYVRIHKIPPEYLRKSFFNIYESSLRKREVYEDDNLYFVIQFTSEISSAPMREIIKKLDIKVLSLISKTALKASLLKEAKEAFSEKLNKYAKYIEAIREIKLEDKIDPQISELLSKREPQVIKVNIEFDSGLNREKYRDITRAVANYIEKQGDITLSEFIGENNALMSVKLSLSSLKTIIDEIDPIARVEKIPEVRLTSSKIKLSLQNFKTDRNGGNEVYIDQSKPLVCILDSGIEASHPELRNSISATFDFMTQLSYPCADRDGHGTFVAGRAVYQDEFPHRIPRVNVIMVKGFENEECVVENPLQMIYTTLQRFCSRSRVFNFSFNANEPSEIQREYLDRWAYQLNVLCVVSSGNIDNEAETPIIRHLNSGRRYPEYIKDYSIFFPGDCYNVLTVGSHTSIGSNIAPNLSPSPFTRSGSLLDRIKPDLLASGGNLNGIFSNGRITSLNKNGFGVKSCNSRFSQTGNLHSEECGTSYSAPIISSLAAQIFNEYPDSSAELVKALIINSCVSLKNPAGQEYDTDIQGHGRCIFDNALYSDDWKVTLLSEQMITPSEIEKADIRGKKLEKVYRMYVPENTTKIIATLVFSNPSIPEFHGFLPIKFKLRLKRVGAKSFRIPSKKYFKKADNVITKEYSIKRGFGKWEVRLTPQIRLLSERYNVRYALVITIINDEELMPIYDEIQRNL
jgi:hypothetical protein